MTPLTDLLSRPIVKPEHPFSLALRERGLTIDDAADALDVSERSVRHWLSWTRRPRRELRERWAEELGQDYFPTLASYARRHPERRRIKLGSVPTDTRGSVASVLVGDALEVLRELPDESAQSCVTSPPYFGLREYTSLPGEIGRERTVDAYVRKLVAVFSEVRRVLRKDGLLWIVIGDSHAGRQETPAEVVRKGKQLLGVPWRIAHALQREGWIVRSEIVWAKTNARPESITDRPTRAHEIVFMLSRSRRYFYDADALKEPLAPESARRYNSRFGLGPDVRERMDRGVNIMSGYRPVPNGKNVRSVWRISTNAGGRSTGGHLAPYPIELASRCVRASTKPGDVVLDPFCGSGTTGLAALRLRRSFIGVDLDPKSARLAGRRLVDEMRDP